MNYTLDFDPVKHEYRLNGKVLPSITQICSPLNYEAAERSEAWRRDFAAKRGTLIHEAAVLVDFGEQLPDEFPDEFMGYVKGYVDFLRDFSPEWVLIEKPLVDKHAGIAGTPDRYGEINGRNIVLDIKTGTRIKHPFVAAQLQGYAKLLAANGYQTDERYCLHLDKSGIYTLYDMTDIAPIFNYLQFIEAHRSEKGRKI